jgi:hypothetical protein
MKTRYIYRQFDHGNDCFGPSIAHELRSILRGAKLAGSNYENDAAANVRFGIPAFAIPPRARGNDEVGAFAGMTGKSRVR